jgi:RNA polymerase primary sigma factor
MPKEIADGVGIVMGPHGRSRPQDDRVTGELSAELRREPTEGELVERLDWTVEQVRDVKGTKPDAASLSKLVSSQDGTSRLKDFILGETSCDVPDAVIEEKAAAWLREAIGRLPQKARYVLVRRYGLDDRDPATLAELAAELNLSRERVRQLQREAEFLLKSRTRRVPRPSVAEDARPRRFWHKGVSGRCQVPMSKEGWAARRLEKCC